MDSTNYKEIQERGIQKVSASDQILCMKSDSIRVDMKPFSHLTNKDLTPNSRITKSLSRKGTQIEAEKINCLMTENDKDVVPSPEEKLMSMTGQTTGQLTAPQVSHHQITIMTGGATTKPAGAPPKSRFLEKRSSSFKQSSIINPRRILFFFATLSSMGTILLLYLTFSMAKYNEEDNSKATNLTSYR